MRKNGLREVSSDGASYWTSTHGALPMTLLIIPLNLDQSPLSSCRQYLAHKAQRLGSETSCSSDQVRGRPGFCFLTCFVLGYIHVYSQLSQAQIESFASVVPPRLSGVEQSEAVLRWIWSNFSAVAGDQPSFECWRECKFLQVDTALTKAHSQSKRLGSS